MSETSESAGSANRDRAGQADADESRTVLTALENEIVELRALQVRVAALDARIAGA